MIEHAVQALEHDVDALFVYRGGEQTAAYRFYRKTNHGDVYYTDYMKLKPHQRADNDTVSSGAERMEDK